ncbi:MAG: efflux RND transporter periplasmic adaptor subunit [Acidobacteriota bacterium]
MTSRLRVARRVLGAAVLIGALLAVALWPRAVPVDVVTLEQGPLRITIDEEGETRIRHRFVVSAPVAGRVQRISLEPGDRVERGRTIVAQIRPDPPALLDARSLAEAEAAAEFAQAAIGRARAEESRAKTARALATRELNRTRELSDAGLTTRQTLEARQSEAKAAEELVDAAQFATASAEAELVRARARLGKGTPRAAGGLVPMTAPVDGVVLKRFRESEGSVQPGAPLVELGDPANLEIVSDLLSTDAVRVEPGAKVLIADWGGDRELEARVRRIEPSGFTKVSALGVEEQRVNVIIDFVDPEGAWVRLGDAFRVEVRIVRWEADRVLKIPTSALFRVGDAWATWVVEHGRAARRLVEIGQRSGREAEVRDGLADGATVIVHPSDAVTEGAAVTPR